MKPSHRKDVIIARIIFAFICIALLAIIVSIVMLVSSHIKSKYHNEPSTSTQTESESEDTNVYEDVPIVTPETESVEQKILVKTTAAVNLRTDADKDSDPITVVPEGTELIVISEQDGWAQVEYAGYSGYVYTEYIQQIAIPDDVGNEEDATGDEQ